MGKYGRRPVIPSNNALNQPCGITLATEENDHDVVVDDGLLAFKGRRKDAVKGGNTSNTFHHLPNGKQVH